MKNILLLGNGFDLYYKLPTKYADFLHIVAFLQNHRKDTFETIGDVFSQQSLQQSDPFIETCYNAHQKTYDSTSLNQDIIDDIVELTEKNLWFSYLQKVYDKITLFRGNFSLSTTLLWAIFWCLMPLLWTNLYHFRGEQGVCFTKAIRPFFVF